MVKRLRQKKIVILDGAMGTELSRRGAKTQLPIWSAQALIEHPQMVREIHKDYIKAGAEIITTNTFRTTSRALSKKNLEERAKELTTLAVNLAKEARAESASAPVWISGSVAPLEDCYQPELIPDSATAIREHAEFIGWLVDAGVDLILIETMNSIQEAVAAAHAAAIHELPIFVSWTCAADGKILNGDRVEDGIRFVEPYRPAAFLINCTPAKDIATALKKMRTVSKVPIGAYANIGKAEPISGWEFTHDLNSAAYVREAENWVHEGAHIVGGCCGTTPEFIHHLKRRFTM